MPHPNSRLTSSAPVAFPPSVRRPPGAAAPGSTSPSGSAGSPWRGCKARRLNGRSWRIPALPRPRSPLIAGDAQRGGQRLPQRSHEGVPLAVGHDALLPVVPLEQLVLLHDLRVAAGPALQPARPRQHAGPAAAHSAPAPPLTAWSSPPPLRSRRCCGSSCRRRSRARRPIASRRLPTPAVGAAVPVPLSDSTGHRPHHAPHVHARPPATRVRRPIPTAPSGLRYRRPISAHGNRRAACPAPRLLHQPTAGGRREV